MKNYGFVRPTIDDTHYLAGTLPKVILQDNADWTDYLPQYEPQFNANFDSDGCTVWGSENGIETYIKKLTSLDENYSERYIYILSNIIPPGGDPHKVMETIRSYGMIPNSALPMTQNFVEFLQPKPMTQDYLSIGQKWLDEFDFKHEWIISKPTKTDDRVSLIKEYLKYSPICVSVTAWHQDGDVYVDKGQPNCHWCLCYGFDDEKRAWKIFDSYDQSTKLYSYDSNIEFAKRLYITIKNKEEQVSVIYQILNKLFTLLGFVTSHPENKPTDIVPEPVIPIPIVEPEPVHGSYLLEWASAIKDYEGKPGDLSYKNNNPGNLRSLSGGFLKFKTWDDGWKALLDYLTRAATGKHKAYKPEFTLLQFFKVYSPSADNNNPLAYATYVAKKLNLPIETQIKTLV